MKVELTLRRDTGRGQPRTFGELTDQLGRHLTHTLEDMVREVAGQPVAAWKVHGETAIPAGHYRLTRQNSGRFGPGTLTLLNVDGFSYIRMHGGNTEKDSEGCPMLGLNRTPAGINNCAPALAIVKDLVSAVEAANDEVWVNILNKPEEVIHG